MYNKKVLSLAAQMLSNLERNRTKGGWFRCSNRYLYKRLEEEIAELKKAVLSGKEDDILHEAADVCNFVMMIADKDRKYFTRTPKGVEI